MNSGPADSVKLCFRACFGGRHCDFQSRLLHHRARLNVLSVVLFRPSAGFRKLLREVVLFQEIGEGFLFSQCKTIKNCSSQKIPYTNQEKQKKHSRLNVMRLDTIDKKL